MQKKRSRLVVLCLFVMPLSQCAKNDSSSTSYSSLTDVTAITAGKYHACALLSSGAVKCWGSNTKGQIGASSGSTCERGSSQEACEKIARQVTGLTTGVTAIAAGKNHTCAIQSGVVKCWGDNSSGQLGNNSTVDSTSPVNTTSVLIGTSVSYVSAGNAHSCAVSGGGAVFCWGANSNGELGNGSNTQSSVPVAVSNLSSGVSEVSAGGGFSCARLSDSSAQCWGNGSYGELGNGASSASNVPVQVTGLTSGVSRISTSLSELSAFACAQVFTSFQCWGDNSYGNLGNNSQTSSSSPVNVSSISSGISFLELGGSQAVSVVSGVMKGWGSNVNSVLGATTGSLTVSGNAVAATSVPVSATNISDTVTQVAAGSDFTCALLSDKTVKCFGANSYASLGNDSDKTSTTAVSVLTE